MQENKLVMVKRDIFMKILLFYPKKYQEQEIIILMTQFKSYIKQREIGNFGKRNITN